MCRNKIIISSASVYFFKEDIEQKLSNNRTVKLYSSSPNLLDQGLNESNLIPINNGKIKIGIKRKNDLVENGQDTLVQI